MVMAASAQSDSCTHCADHKSRLPARTLIAASGLLIAVGFALRWANAAPWLAVICFAGSSLAGGLLVFPAAWRSLLRWKLNMNVLMSVAVVGAWMMGEHAEAAAVVFLFSLSEWLESLSGERARHAIRSLMSLAPETALRKRNGSEMEEVSAFEVKVGEIIVVRSGQRIPLDGAVMSGRSSVNQAPITGESVPVDKEPGDEIFAGTINGEGSIEVSVTKPASDSTVTDHQAGRRGREKPRTNAALRGSVRRHLHTDRLCRSHPHCFDSTAFLRWTMERLGLPRAGASRDRLSLRLGHRDAGVNCFRTHRLGAARCAGERWRSPGSARKDLRLGGRQNGDHYGGTPTGG